MAQTRHIDQWNGIERSEIKPWTYGQLVHEKGGNGEKKKSISSISDAGKTGWLNVTECNQNILYHHLQKTVWMN